MLCALTLLSFDSGMDDDPDLTHLSESTGSNELRGANREWPPTSGNALDQPKRAGLGAGSTPPTSTNAFPLVAALLVANFCTIGIRKHRNPRARARKGARSRTKPAPTFGQTLRPVRLTSTVDRRATRIGRGRGDHSPSRRVRSSQTLGPGPIVVGARSPCGIRRPRP